MVLQIGRGCDEDQRVVSLGGMVEVGRERYLVDVKLQAGDVGRVVTGTLEVGNAVVPSHVPAYAMSVAHHDFSQGRCP